MSIIFRGRLSSTASVSPVAPAMRCVGQASRARHDGQGKEASRHYEPDAPSASTHRAVIAGAREFVLGKRLSCVLSRYRENAHARPSAGITNIESSQAPSFIDL